MLHLDGWRGLSILLVLLGHFSSAYRAGHLGVELFFILSGRLMAHILLEQRQPVRVFVWRRVVRVWPALWCYVALVTTGLAISSAWGDERHALLGALAAVTFTANYVAATVSIPYVDHSWSLAVEEHGYLLLALIAVAARRRAVVAATVALELAGAAVVNGWWQGRLPGADLYYLYLRTDVRVASVLLPFALFALLRGRATPGWLPLIALGVGAWFATMEPGPWRFVGTAALALAAATIDRAPAVVLRALSCAPLRWAGAASFSLYLWQQPFMMLYRAGSPAWPCLAGAGLLGLWSYYRVEQPARARLAGLQPWRLPRRSSGLAAA